MALFTDGDVSEHRGSAGVRHPATRMWPTIEGIDVTRKLTLAQEEIAAEIARLLLDAAAGWFNAPPTIPAESW